MTKRTALITGAALRVGRALALSLADDGWDIALHYHQSAKPARELGGLIARKGRKVHLVRANLGKEKEVARIFPSLAERGMIPDCLINNAALFEKDDLQSLERKQWQMQMEVNLLAPLLLMRDFAAHYKGHEGNIINITDGLSGWSMSPVFLSYTLSKQALTHATRMLARELAPRIRVNAIAPGATLMSKHDKKDTFAKLTEIVPLKRASSPGEVCDAMHYLLSAPSLTGQILSLSGGMD
jgi:NAD(P)-dependent dehydrogenase (short-subunit alcohol dehydrogenase family)